MQAENNLAQVAEWNEPIDSKRSRTAPWIFCRRPLSSYVTRETRPYIKERAIPRHRITKHLVNCPKIPCEWLYSLMGNEDAFRAGAHQNRRQSRDHADRSSVQLYRFQYLHRRPRARDVFSCIHDRYESVSVAAKDDLNPHAPTVNEITCDAPK